MSELKVGVQLQPQATTVEQLREAWRATDGLGVDSIWIWDHFYPLSGDPGAAHFECYTLLAALAVETSRARFGAMVTCNSYRNPNLLADMARTMDHLSDGRFILGIGSGWKERDYVEYGYEFGTTADRLARLARDLPIIKERLAALTPRPMGPMPILIGGSGERVTLRLVAQHAQMWNAGGSPEVYAAKSAILDQWCEKLDRDPSTVERTIIIGAGEVDQWEAFAASGATHFIVMAKHPFDLEPAAALIERTKG